MKLNGVELYAHLTGCQHQTRPLRHTTFTWEPFFSSDAQQVKRAWQRAV